MFEIMTMVSLHRRDMFSWLAWRFARWIVQVYWSAKIALHPGYRPLVFGEDMRGFYERLERHNWFAGICVYPKCAPNEIDRAEAEFEEFEAMAASSKVHRAMLDAYTRYVSSGDPFTHEFDFRPKPVIRASWPAGTMGKMLLALQMGKTRVEFIGKTAG